MNGYENEILPPGLTPPQHPLKLFDLAESQGRFLYACAPMVRYSKLAFRQTVHAYGTDLCWTPMILAKEFNRSSIARDSDFTISTTQPQPPTIVQFGANVPQELARASSLVIPYVGGVDLNCGCPQSWACAETLGAALMEKRELVRDMVLETRSRLRNDGWAMGLERDVDNSRGRSVSVKIRVHKDLRKTIDFIDTVLGPDQDRHIDWLTIHPRTRSTPSTTPINLEALELLTEKYGDRVPILVSGDVFSMGSLPYNSPYYPNTNGNAVEAEQNSKPHLPKLRGLMSARALLANPAIFAGHETCPWDAVELFLNNAVRAPIPLALVQHHLGEMCSPGYGPNKTSLLTKKERFEMHNLTNMCDVLDWMDEKMKKALEGRDGIRRNVVPSTVQAR